MTLVWLASAFPGTGWNFPKLCLISVCLQATSPKVLICKAASTTWLQNRKGRWSCLAEEITPYTHAPYNSSSWTYSMGLSGLCHLKVTGFWPSSTSQAKAAWSSCWEPWLLTGCMESPSWHPFCTPAAHCPALSSQQTHYCQFGSMTVLAINSCHWTRPVFRHRVVELLTNSAQQGILRCRRVACLQVSLPRAPLLPELTTPASTHQRPGRALSALACTPCRIFLFSRNTPNPSYSV